MSDQETIWAMLDEARLLRQQANSHALEGAANHGKRRSIRQRAHDLEERALIAAGVLA